jgi:hypothetical protein
MILSKRYKEELDKIVMSEDMKKRILHNVLNKNIEAKSTIPRVKKYNNLKRSMQLAAACFTVVVCLSVVKSHTEFFKHENSNFEQNQVIKDSDAENKVLKNSEESEANINNKDNTNDNNMDSTNNNDSAEKREIINSDISNDENYKKSNSIKNKSNDELYNNENSSQIEQKEESSDNSQVNSSSSSKINSTQQTNAGTSAANSSVSSETSPQSQTNTNTETARPKSLDNNSNDVTKNQDETTSNKNKRNNEVNNSPSLAAYGYFSKEYKTLQEAEDAVKLKINSVKALPKGFNMDNISVISNEIIQIEYSNGQDGITFRAGKDTDNISGDYNIYEIKNTCKVNGMNITLEGNKNKVFNLATWEKDGISFSISSTNGIDEDVILNMIRSS